jgi:hypothetical protein
MPRSGMTTKRRVRPAPPGRGRTQAGYADEGDRPGSGTRVARTCSLQ